MWEIWRNSEKFKVARPTAWFNDEEEARDYVEYLGTIGEPAIARYNETAVMPDWNAPTEWHEPVK